MTKTLISIFSMSYYREHSHSCQYSNPFLLYVTSPKNPNLPELVFSLLNFLSEYNENGTLPYVGWLKYDPLYIKTALLSSQLLSLLLEPTLSSNLLNENVRNSVDLQEVINYYLDLLPQDSVKIREGSATLPDDSDYFNSCQEILCNFCYTVIGHINDQNYIKKLAQNLLKLLKGNSLEAKNTFLMFSMKEISFLEEVFIIMWRLTQNNRYFINFLLEGSNGLDFLSCILTMIHEKFNVSFQSGTFNLAITFLTHLSLVRDFTTRINTPLKQSFIFHSLPVISGNYGDFLITVLHSGMMTCFEQKIPCFYMNLTAILLNMSPYFQNLSKSSSFKLVQLVQLFSNYETLLENQSNGDCLVKMQRIIDNILVHQGEVY